MKRSLILAILILAGVAAVARPSRPAAAMPGFVGCGPNATTYTVTSAGNVNTGTGIRCLRTFGTVYPYAASFVWYGEGSWNGRTYRHMGLAVWNPGDQTYGVSGADIYGNGEQFNTVFSGNVQFTAVIGSFPAPQMIKASYWNEIWTRADIIYPGYYTPLPRPQRCGPNFEQYSVSSLTPGVQGTGLRCVFRAYPYTIWFGNGVWDTAYTNIGVTYLLWGQQYGESSDLCGGVFGGVCYKTAPYALRFTPRWYGYDVTGAWNEAWRW